MRITGVRVQLVRGSRSSLRAFCSITIEDAFVVRDLKVIETAKGLFVAMPSRKRMSRCCRCGIKNVSFVRFCNHCGEEWPGRQDRRETPSVEQHTDIAHPIHADCRQALQEQVLREFERACAGTPEPARAFVPADAGGAPEDSRSGREPEDRANRGRDGRGQESRGPGDARAAFAEPPPGAPPERPFGEGLRS